ncbi:enoyl-CoA hydratase/isomerase family protein [uncultured Enterovirga sp.]|uniref:enoyl-CoA hydratase/isomerase family protein n=1 Tax=uncultured Enterovirga sp. TaxID=2026352 RepID=UPI0035CA4EB8
MDEPEIISERRGAAGIVTLNRPRALNALTQGMVDRLAEALDRWESDPAVTRIIVKGAGDRAFCAGGDVRALYEAGRGGRVEEAFAFWRTEYRLNIRIKRYPKPYVALIDGLVMGGGVGVSLHGSHRVAGDRYSLAMPEVGIGFVPDVGATYALPRLPDETGMYLALTGARVGADDAAAIGLATHLVPSGDFEALEAALVSGEPVDTALAQASRPAAEGPLSSERGTIQRRFSAESVPAVLAALDEAAAAGSDFARDCAATIRTKAPSSLSLAFAQVRRGREMTFEEAMVTEFRIVSRVARGHDFYEGVRAAIIDKDGRPRWNPETLAGIDPAFVEAHVAPLGRDDLEVSP